MALIWAIVLPLWKGLFGKKGPQTSGLLVEPLKGTSAMRLPPLLPWRGTLAPSSEPSMTSWLSCKS